MTPSERMGKGTKRSPTVWRRSAAASLSLVFALLAVWMRSRNTNGFRRDSRRHGIEQR